MSEAEIEDYRLRKLWYDVLVGDGKDNPSIVTRLDRLENFQEQTEEWRDDLKGWIKALILFSLGQTCTIIGGLIWIVVNKK